MKKVAIYINNYGTTNRLLPNLRTANPGIGGSQYEMFLFVQCYAEKANDGLDFELSLLTSHPQTADFPLSPIVTPSMSEVFNFCNKNGIDYLILRANDGLKELDQLHKTKIIYWAHNFIGYEAATKIALSQVVERVVFVSHEEADFYYDHDIIAKGSVIYNAIPDFVVRDYPSTTKENRVVFIGDISPYKMLHRLTKIWPRIVRKIPDAQLVVIGNGNLYGKNAKLGERQLAQADYEQTILDPLIKHKILDKVEFMGLIGEKKSEIIEKAKIGVLMNPMETFCIAATDIITCGVPVVAPQSSGYCDVISHRKTGYLCPSQKAMERQIIRLLKQDESLSISKESLSYLHAFSINAFWENWRFLLSKLGNGESIIPLKHKPNLRVNHKWLGVLLHHMRKILHLSNKFSRLGIKTSFRNIIRRK